ncbi:MAG: hypothetical protein WAL91_10505, partial [Propionicimonas sp.]
MFSFRNDPDADGVGVAFFDAVAPDGGRLDLSLTVVGGWRSRDWEVAEARLGVPVLNAYQVHGVTVATVDATTEAEALATRPADALVTSSRRVA